MSIFLYFLIFLALLILLSRQGARRRLPPGPFPWPVVGNIPLLLAHSNTRAPHRKFAELARRYGPVFFLRLGSIPTVIISSPAIAKDLLHGPNDLKFANRPHSDVGSRALYPDLPILTQYGPRYRIMRKFLMLELSKIVSRPAIRMEEICHTLSKIERQSDGETVPVNLSRILGESQANMLTRIVLSRKVTEEQGVGDNNSLHLIIQEMVNILGAPVVGNFIPYLGWLDWRVKRRADALHRVIDSYLEGIMAERRKGEKNGDGRDFLDAAMANEELSEGQIKAAALVIIAGGVDTSSVAVEWVLAELIRHPRVFDKLREELNTTMAGQDESLVTQSDIPKLSYLHAVINETLRLHPILPILFPHVTHEECEVGGYFLPKNTQAIVNAWAIGRSTSVWGEKAGEFWPERFVGSDINPKGNHMELLSFGAGRRMCLGMGLGLNMVELILANLVRTFEWHLPPPLTPQDVDMEEAGGLVTVRRAQPLVLLPKVNFPKIPTSWN